ncbi:ABC transporter permease [Lysinimonas soli]|uniref:ABC transporter permease n=1 Tax=Lysinimonas soli TaxID=1074233 RepID=A0ABW0NJI0_9MICO
MRVIADIVGRNLRIYFRDRLGVFFSLLGALVLFLLYMLFLRTLQTGDLANSFPAASSASVSAFVDTWMFAGIISITTITTGLGAFSSFVDDAVTARFRDFLVSPIRRSQLSLGYLISSFVIAMTMSIIVLVLSLAYLFFVDGLLLGVATIAIVVGEIALSCLAFAALSAFGISFVRTQGAFAALSTIVGTVLGFIAGAYVPVGAFPEGVRNVINALPFGQLATLIRQQLSEGTLAKLTAGQPQATERLSAVYGITASVGDWQVPTAYVLAVLAAMAVVFTALAAARIRSRLR